MATDAVELKKADSSSRHGSLLTSYVLLIVSGFLGGHHVYLQNIPMAFMYATTIGFGGVGLVGDAILLPFLVRKKHPARAARVILTAYQLLLQLVGAVTYGRAALTIIKAIQDVDELHEIESVQSRALAYALLAVAASAAVIMVLKGFRKYSVSFGTVMIGTMVAVGVMDMIAASARQGASIDVVAALSAMVIAGVFKQPVDKADVSNHVPSSVCRKGLKVSAFGTLACIVWLTYFAAGLLRIELPVTQEWHVHPEGQQYKPLGAILWHHRSNLRGEADNLLYTFYHYTQTEDYERLRARALGIDRDDYEVLGLPRSATLHEVRQAHRELVKEYHPDRQAPGATQQELQESMETFRRVQRAYERLIRRLGRGSGAPSSFP